MIYVIMTRDEEVYGVKHKAGDRVKTDREMAKRLVIAGVAKLTGENKPIESAMMEQPEKAIREKPEPKMPFGRGRR